MEKRETTLRKNKRSAEVYSDTHTEYVLPDYLGEIRKLLSVSSEIRPAAKYLSDSGVESSGIVVYDVLYTDADGELSGASFTSDYDVLLPRREDGESLCLESRIVSFNVRPSGPRKLSAKATVAVSDISSHTEDVSPEGTAFADDREPELLTEDISLLSVVETESVERELAESILRLDGRIADETSVISSRAEAECESVSLAGGEATVKGYVSVYAIVKTEDAAPYSVTHKLPFSETLAFDKDISGEIFPRVTVSSIGTTVNADNEGCEIVANVIFDLSLTSFGRERASIVTDAYLCECDTQNEYDKLCYTELLHASRERINHTARLSRSDECIDGFDELLTLVGTARLSQEIEGDAVVLRGTLKYTGAATAVCESGERSYMPLKFEVPIEEKIALPHALPDNATLDVAVEAHHPTLTLDSESVYVTSTLGVSLVITEDKCIRRLASATASENVYEKSSATVTVYYPEAGDTLFSVAKSHRTRAAKLARDNALTESVVAGKGECALSGIKKLIIY